MESQQADIKGVDHAQALNCHTHPSGDATRDGAEQQYDANHVELNARAVQHVVQLVAEGC
jgi:hypothetical protein